MGAPCKYRDIALDSRSNPRDLAVQTPKLLSPERNRLPLPQPDTLRISTCKRAWVGASDSRDSVWQLEGLRLLSSSTSSYFSLRVRDHTKPLRVIQASGHASWLRKLYGKLKPKSSLTRFLQPFVNMHLNPEHSSIIPGKPTCHSTGFRNNSLHES